MTVSVQTTYNTATGNGVTTVFPYQFKILAAADLQVYIAGVLKTLGIDYTVSGVGADVGGSVTFISGAPAAAAVVSIIRVMTVKRTTDYQQLGDFLTPVVNPDFDNAVLLIQDLQTQLGRSIRTPANEVGTIPTLPSIASRAGLFMAFDSGGQPIGSAGTGNDSALRTDLASTVAGGNRLVSVLKSAGESAAGAAIVNGSYPVGYVDRYGTNTTPGTTDMTAAFNAAFAVAAQTGCQVRWGATAPYRLNSPVNCTGMRGAVAWDESSKNLSAGAPSVIIAHDGATSSHGFDLSTSTNMVFNNVVAQNLAGKIPNSVFFMARNAAASGAGQHRFVNCSTPSNCTFRHIYYGYASEENVLENCIFYNSQAGSSCVNINASNASNYTSAFQTIATGSQSNAQHILTNVNLFNTGNSGSTNEICISMERADNFTWNTGLAYCPHGLAYISVGGISASNYFSVRSVRGEVDAAATTSAAIAIRTSAATGAGAHAHWTLDNFSLNSIGGALLDFNATSDIADLNTRGCFASSGNFINAHSISNSIIEHGTGAVTAVAGGTVANSIFVGNRVALTFSGTDTNNQGFDEQNGVTWQSGDTVALGSTACTGAIIAAAAWTARKQGKLVVLSLPALTAVATAATSFTFGQVLPSAYRPAANIRMPIIVQDNGAVLNQVGFVLINAASGAISVFKDLIATTNFTAAAGAGLPAATAYSWTTP